jgi:hypothetical protein
MGKLSPPISAARPRTLGGQAPGIQIKPRRSGAWMTWKRVSLRFGLHGRDVRRLQTFGALDHVETNSLAFRQCLKAFDLDFTEVDEEILALRLLNESVALFGTKPLDSPLSQPCNLHVFRGDAAIRAHPSLCARPGTTRTRRDRVAEPEGGVKTRDAKGTHGLDTSSRRCPGAGGARRQPPHPSRSRKPWAAR